MVSNSLFILFTILFALSTDFCSTYENLEIMNHDELKQLFEEEKYIITLISDKEECSQKCLILEKSLASIREELVEGTGGWVVRGHSSELVEEYGVQDSTILFLRDGKPLIYSGESDDEERILNYLLSNKESTVHNLTDVQFEHETQAGTGATTGDWLVMFTRHNCKPCSRLYPVIEGVAVKLKGRKNTAIVNRDGEGAVTARRFGVKTFPSFILFRLGKLYRFELPLQTVETLTAFAEDGFRNAKGENVPPPKTPFDDVTEAAADWLKENPGTFLMSVAGVLLVIIILVLLNRPPPEAWRKSKKKKN